MKKISTIIAGICVLGMAIVLTGCGAAADKNVEKEAEYKPAVCFVIANTANSQSPNFSSPLIQDTVVDCTLNYGFAAVINADGNSEVLVGESFDIDEMYKNASVERLKMDARARANNVLGYMETVIADDPEIDYLEALRLAGRTLSSLEGYTSKTIIVLGTGLSTTGYMDFGNNLISAEPEAIADALQEKEAIPDFTAMTVFWQGMGDTAAPQEALSPAQRTRLQNTWAAVISRGGGEFIPNDFISNPVNENADYPEVTVVDLPMEAPVVFEPEELQAEPDANAFRQPFILSEDQVAFVGDKSEYLNPEDAVKTISPIAEYLLQYESVKLLLVGSTAGDETNESTLKLSLERAEAVKNTLIELGVDGNRIVTIGMGSSDPWHVPNAGYEGSIASGNRKVVLLDADSEQAQEIMNR